MTRHLPRDKRGALNPISGLPPTSAHTFTTNIICTRTTGRAACREKIKRSQNCKQLQVELRCEFYLPYTNTEDLQWGCPAPRHETWSSEMCYPQPRLLLWPGVSPQCWRSSSLERPPHRRTHLSVPSATSPNSSRGADAPPSSSQRASPESETRKTSFLWKRELLQLLFSQVRFIQGIESRLEFFPKSHPHLGFLYRVWKQVMKTGLGLIYFLLSKLLIWKNRL